MEQRPGTGTVSRFTLPTVKPRTTGIAATAGGLAVLGSALVETGVPQVVMIGIGLEAFSGVTLIGLGIYESVKSASGSQTSSSDDMSVDQPDGDALTIPTAELFGDGNAVVEDLQAFVAGLALDPNTLGDGFVPGGV